MPLLETIQNLRSQYERGATLPPVRSYKRILARNNDFFISELSNTWQTNYERRKKNLSRGFFSANILPYKTCGELKHLDLYELIKEHLKIEIVTTNYTASVRDKIRASVMFSYNIASLVKSGALSR